MTKAIARVMSPLFAALFAALFVALVAALLVVAAMPVHAIDPAQLPDPKLEARYDALLHEFRCPVCQTESLAESPADAAGEMRAQIRRMLVEGKSDAQIKQYFVSRYSEFILFKPEYSLRNAWLWLLPVVLLAIGILVAMRIIRGRVALVDEDADDPDDQLAEHPHASEATRDSRSAGESGSARLNGPVREGATHG